MKTIKSKDNSIYKSALKLAKKKYRDETGLYLLEGIKPLEDAVSMGVDIRIVFICEGAERPENLPEDLCVILARKLFDELSDTSTSQGVIAVAEKQRCTLDEFRRHAAEGSGNVVVMDRVQDPGNIGTIIRTSEAAGYKGIIAVSGTGDVYSPKVVRAAAGSLFRMPVIFAKDAKEAAEILKGMGKNLTVTCLEGAVNCFEVDLTKDIALVIGNEGRGVSESFMKLSDIKVKIPMEGAIESLNAAVAAGILMYQSQKIK